MSTPTQPKLNDQDEAVLVDAYKGDWMLYGTLYPTEKRWLIRQGLVTHDETPSLTDKGREVAQGLLSKEGK